MMKKILILLIIFLITFSINPPVWPNVWSQQFVQNYTAAGGVYTVGKHWFDYNRPAQRVTYQTGRYDAVCGSVLPNITTPCTQLIVNGNLYVIYPERQQCCRCCSGIYGCTVKNPNWIQPFSYQGQQNLSGQMFYKWSYQNLIDYYAKQNEQMVPRRIHTAGHKTQDFIMNTYSQAPIDDQIFKLPNYCNKDCPRTTVCGQIQPNIVQNLKLNE